MKKLPAILSLLLLLALTSALSSRALLAAEEFDSRAMLDMGFLDYLVLPGRFADAIDELAAKLAGLAPLAVRSMKNILSQVLAGSVDEEQVKELADLCAHSEDFKEGIAAQREKREPRFSGA